MSITQRNSPVDMGVADKELQEIDRRGLAGTEEPELLIHSQRQRSIVISGQHGIYLKMLPLQPRCQLRRRLIIRPPE